MSFPAMLVKGKVQKTSYSEQQKNVNVAFYVFYTDNYIYNETKYMKCYAYLR